MRGPLPAHLPRERVVIPGPTACPCCRGRLSKLGEDVTETLEVVPRRWKVIQTVRERFSCRACETISQAPAPFHPIARGRAGPELLATILEAKFGQHLPLNRQSETFAREGIELDTSTLADWVGACTANLSPLVALIRAHVMAAERLHGDDTTVPVLARGKTSTGRLWTYVRDDRGHVLAHRHGQAERRRPSGRRWNGSCQRWRRMDPTMSCGAGWRSRAPWGASLNSPGTGLLAFGRTGRGNPSGLKESSPPLGSECGQSI